MIGKYIPQGFRNLDEEAIEQKAPRIVSPIVTALLLVGFVYLHTLANDYSRTVRMFPLVVVRFAIIFLVLLLLKETVVPRFVPELATADTDRMEYLRGSKSQFSIPTRIKRLILLAFFTALFFILGNINFLAGFVVCYVGMIVSLGIRNPKMIVGTTAAITIFVYFVFIIILEVPLGVF